jgi:hypothetical protein
MKEIISNHAGDQGDLNACRDELVGQRSLGHDGGIENQTVHGELRL